MAENDRARGVEQLPGARAIASAIAEAARGPDAPETGQATFEVRVDRRGHAVELSLASAASGDVKAWRVVADNAARSIKGRSFALGAAFARGAKVYVDVIAEKALPSGKSRWFDPKRMFDRDRLPLPKPRLPDDTSTAGGKLNVPDAIFQLRVIDFDVTNFGARAKRGVRASFRISPVY